MSMRIELLATAFCRIKRENISVFTPDLISGI